MCWSFMLHCSLRHLSTRTSVLQRLQEGKGASEAAQHDTTGSENQRYRLHAQHYKTTTQTA